MAAVPRERDATKRQAAIPVGMTPRCRRNYGGEHRCTRCLVAWEWKKPKSTLRRGSRRRQSRLYLDSGSQLCRRANATRANAQFARSILAHNGGTLMSPEDSKSISKLTRRQFAVGLAAAGGSALLVGGASAAVIQM